MNHPIPIACPSHRVVIVAVYANHPDRDAEPWVEIYPVLAFQGTRWTEDNNYKDPVALYWDPSYKSICYSDGIDCDDGAYSIQVCYWPPDEDREKFAELIGALFVEAKEKKQKTENARAAAIAWRQANKSPRLA